MLPCSSCILQTIAFLALLPCWMVPRLHIRSRIISLLSDNVQAWMWRSKTRTVSLDLQTKRKSCYCLNHLDDAPSQIQKPNEEIPKSNSKSQIQHPYATTIICKLDKQHWIGVTVYRRRKRQRFRRWDRRRLETWRILRTNYAKRDWDVRKRSWRGR